MKNKILGTLVGLAAGDAIGTTVEFKPRGTFPPVTDMVGGGPFNLKVGQWTDDTSMALCLADSIIKNGFDCHDQMIRYCDWWKNGYMSSTGKCFDIGFTTSWALDTFLDRDDEFGSADDSDGASGNGGLMRIAPVIMAYHNHVDFYEYVLDCTRTTHASPKCLDASILFSKIVARAYQSEDKHSILVGHDLTLCITEEINDINCGKYLSMKYEELNGSGYVINSLITALWCFYHTDNFKDAILMAVNVGDDADTVGAICGQIAGAYYGLDGIPPEWVNKLHEKDMLLRMSEELYVIGLVNDIT